MATVEPGGVVVVGGISYHHYLLAYYEGRELRVFPMAPEMSDSGFAWKRVGVVCEEGWCYRAVSAWELR